MGIRTPVRAGPLPTFLIAGAMKAGTTSFAAWLSGHPDVYVAPVKEIHFFDSPINFQRGEAWYRSNFAGAAGEGAIGEATPGYMAHARAVQRIAETLPNVRLITLLRHPVDRAFSQYIHRRELGQEKRTFEDAIEHDLANPDELGLGRYVARGRYHEQLTRLESVFGRDAILPLLFDDFAVDPTGPYADACRFIGVDPSVSPPGLGHVHNPRPRLRSHMVHRVARRAPGAVARSLERWNNRSSLPYTPLAGTTRNRLIETFRPDIEALQAWLGRDLSAWLDPDPDHR